MVLSTEQLLKKLQGFQSDTLELSTTLNTLLGEKNVFSSPVLNFKLSSVLLNSLCSDSKWMLMDADMKSVACQLLASDIGVGLLVKNIKKGLDMLCNFKSDLNQLNKEMQTNLTFAGTYIPPQKETSDLTSDQVELKVKLEPEHSNELLIKPQAPSRSLATNDQSKSQSQQGTLESLYLPLNQNSVTIHFDILLFILENYLDLLMDHLSTQRNAHGASFRDFKYLISTKIPEVLGYGLIFGLDNPNGLSIEKFKVDNNRIRHEIDSYPQNVIEKVININDNLNSYLAIEIILELWKRDSHILNVVLNNWLKVLDLFQPVDTSLKRDANGLHLLKSFTTQLFHSVDNIIQQPRLAEWYSFICSWVEKINNLAPNKRTIYDLIYVLCESSKSQLSILIWLNAINYVNVEWVNRSITKYGSKPFINNASIKTQENLAMLLIVMIDQVDDDKIPDLSSNKIFLDAITNRLESKLEDVRFLGMLVADHVYQREHKKQLFTVNCYSNKRESYLLKIEGFRTVIESSNTIPLTNAINTILNEKTITISANKDDQIVKNEQPLIIELQYDSDAEDSDLDDPSVSRKPTIAKPVFLKDLDDYLTCNTENDNKTYYKRGIAFSIGIEMVRLKAQTAELEFYATKLLDAVSNISDFGFPDLPKDVSSGTSRSEAFNIWKISFMIGVIVSSPKVSFVHLFKGFLENDISTPQRVQILSAIGFACRELCGEDENDVFIWGKKNQEKVAPSSIKGPGHAEFVNLDSKFEEVLDSKQEEMLVEYPNENFIGIGTVLKRSRKLEIDADNLRTNQQSHLKQKVTSYINRELPKLFYSLTSIWNELNFQTGGSGFMAGNMSEILNSHYLSIISMVYKCAVPSCIDLVDMSREMIQIIREQLFIISTNTSEEFPHLMFAGTVKCAGSLVLDNEITIKVLSNSTPMEFVELINLLTNIMNEHGDSLNGIMTLSKAAKVVLELQKMLRFQV